MATKARKRAISDVACGPVFVFLTEQTREIRGLRVSHLGVSTEEESVKQGTNRRGVGRRFTVNGLIDWNAVLAGLWPR